MMQCAESQQKDDDALALRFHWVIALYGQNDMNQARDEFMNWKSAILAWRGKNDKRTTEDLYVIAYTLFNIGAFSEAEYMLRDIVPSLGKWPDAGADASAWYHCLSLLGVVYWHTNELQDAEKALRTAVARQEENTLGLSPWDVSYTVLWLTSTLARQSKYEDARTLSESVTQNVVSATDDTILTNHRDIMANVEDAIQSSQSVTNARWQLDTSGTEFETVLKEYTSHILQENIPSIPFNTLSTRMEPLERLDIFFHSRRVGSYSYAEVAEISRLLEICSIPVAAKAPRTYIVLRHMECLDMLERLVDAGFSDYRFPVSENNLPDILSTAQKEGFNRLQRLILDPAMSLERAENGTHQIIADEESVPFRRQKLLGKGGFGEVDKVFSLITFREYARKCVSRPSVFRKKSIECMRQLEEEIQILKRLKHRHTVKYVGSYTSPANLGLIMTPIADLDLAEYLQVANAGHHIELRTFFGCLASGLAYLHQSGIRHKDIKPRNILVHHGNILFADFGLSFDFSGADGDTTVSMVNGMTPRYCAAEVADCRPRNKSADIWSLGVVYLEMTTILAGKDVEFMRRFLETHGTEVEHVQKNVDGLTDYLIELHKLVRKQDHSPLLWIENMLQMDPRKRPHAASLVETILDARGESGVSDFCGMCCSGEIETGG
ncbi:hypothetical protein DPSP01_005372 [Paraphaeosphaeria sporulosa]